MQKFLKDVVLTDPEGIWVDARAYNSLAECIADIGTTETNLVIAAGYVVNANLTIPANITMSIQDGCGIEVTAGVTLTLNCSVKAPRRQAFSGNGNFVFYEGSVLNSLWFSNLADAVNKVNSANVTLIVDSVQTITSGVTVPSNVTLDIRRGGRLDPASGVTVWIESPAHINALSSQQIKGGSGWLRFTDSCCWVYPGWWYTGAGSWHTAINEALATGAPVKIPKKANAYEFSNQILNSEAVPIVCEGELEFTGSGTTAIVIGKEGSSQIIGDRSPIVTSISVTRSAADYTDDYPGIELINIYKSELRLRVKLFATGVYARGYDGGFAYNTVHLQSLNTCKTGLALHAGGTSGYANQNTFIGGAFTGSYNSADDIVGVRFIQDSGKSINGNVFYNPCFELVQAGVGSSSIWHGESNAGETAIAVYNEIIGGRKEGTDYILSGIGLSDNKIHLTRSGYLETRIGTFLNGDTDDDTLDLVRNKFALTEGRSSLTANPVKIAYLRRSHVVEYEPGANIYLTAPARGLFWEGGGSADFYRGRPGNDLKDDHIIIDRSNVIMGFLLDMRNVGTDFLRKIEIKATVSDTGGRFAAITWDDTFSAVTSSGACSLTYGATQGFFLGGEDITTQATEQTVSFGSGVSYAFVGIAEGSASAKIKTFEIYASDGNADIRLSLDSDLTDSIGTRCVLLDTDDPVCEQCPASPEADNNYAEGTFVRSTDIASGGTKPIGWYYDGTAWQAGPVIP